jgi:hypothetical protein
MVKSKSMPKQIGVRIPTAELNRLRAIAEAEGRTISGQVRYYVRRAIAQENQERQEAVHA